MSFAAAKRFLIFAFLPSSQIALSLQENIGRVVVEDSASTDEAANDGSGNEILCAMSLVRNRLYLLSKPPLHSTPSCRWELQGEGWCQDGSANYFDHWNTTTNGVGSSYPNKATSLDE